MVDNQWHVDFNLSLQSFEPHIHGVRRLIDFSTQSTLGAKIVFISSISSTIGEDSNETVPEALLETPSYSGTGYGASKLISEGLLSEGAKQSGVESTICRVGQVGGPVRKEGKGRWNKQEWLPTVSPPHSHTETVLTFSDHLNFGVSQMPAC
jgi:nucleoside-diphosphate-sugar epimerase